MKNMTIITLALTILSSCCYHRKKQCKTWNGTIEVESGAISDGYDFDSLIEFSGKTRIYQNSDSIDFSTKEVSGVSYVNKQECDYICE